MLGAPDQSPTSRQAKPAVQEEHLKALSLQVRLAALCLDEPFRAREAEALIALLGEVLMDDWGLVERTLF